MEAAAGSMIDRTATRVRFRMWWLVAGLVVLTVPWNLWGVYGGTVDPDQEDALPFVIIAAVVIIAVVGVTVFRAAMARTTVAGADGARWALPLSVVALVLFPVTFWSSVPFALGCMGAVVGAAARRRAAEDGRSTRRATAALWIGAAAAVLSAVLGFVGVWL